ncbi:MAG TPA: hypothetical protein VLF93_07765 [Candidatus Saccharimonadales bacterium]|nr:hypothetical protein [Candidatus Saccharimonadales bacterium]
MTEAFTHSEVSISEWESFWNVQGPIDLEGYIMRADLLDGIKDKSYWKSYMHATPEQISLAQNIGQAILEGPLAAYGWSSSTRLNRGHFQLVVPGAYEYDYKGDVKVKVPDGTARDAYLVCTEGINFGEESQRFDFNDSDWFDQTLHKWSIMDPINDDVFQVKVGSKVYDTRGMNQEAYSAMVLDQGARNRQNLKRNLNGYTYLTGEPMRKSTVDARYPVMQLGAYVINNANIFAKLTAGVDEVRYGDMWSRHYRKYGSSYRFRPAVKLPVAA